ncbi:MAG: hypothetical protein ACTHK1_13615 [Actinomycetales bacterium]
MEDPDPVDQPTHADRDGRQPGEGDVRQPGVSVAVGVLAVVVVVALVLLAFGATDALRP